MSSKNESVRCQGCGSTQSVNAARCTLCGAMLSNASTVAPPSSSTVTVKPIVITEKTFRPEFASVRKGVWANLPYVREFQDVNEPNWRASGKLLRETQNLGGIAILLGFGGAIRLLYIHSTGGLLGEYDIVLTIFALLFGPAVMIEPRLFIGGLPSVKRADYVGFKMLNYVAGVVIAAVAIAVQHIVFKDWVEIPSALVSTDAVSYDIATTEPFTSEEQLRTYLSRLATRDERRRRILDRVSTEFDRIDQKGEKSPKEVLPLLTEAEEVCQGEVTWMRTTPCPAPLEAFAKVYVQYLAWELDTMHMVLRDAPEAEIEKRALENDKRRKQAVMEAERIQQQYPGLPQRDWGA